MSFIWAWASVHHGIGDDSVRLISTEPSLQSQQFFGSTRRYLIVLVAAFFFSHKQQKGLLAFQLSSIHSVGQFLLHCFKLPIVPLSKVCQFY